MSDVKGHFLSCTMLQGIFVMGGVTNLLSQEIGEIKMRNKFSVTIERVAWLARLKI